MTAQMIPYGRQTLYKGTAMRSRLEARVAAALDAAGIVWDYEPQCFADQFGQYLPDFSFDLCGRTQYLELKGWLPDEKIGEVQRRMQVIWSSDPKAVLMLWEDFPQRRQWLATQTTGWVEA